MSSRISSSNTRLSGISSLFRKKLIPVKVKDIILDGSTEKAATYGGYDSVGLIFYNKIRIKNDGLNSNPDASERQESGGFDGIAKPIFPFMKYYPLLNETVLVLSTTSKDYIADRLARFDYYFPPLNLWNHPHHNTLPAVANYAEDKSRIITNEDYEQAGLLRRAVEGEVDLNIPLGEYFKEQLNIKPLLPYEGDHIIEGRFGNSIRFGATARSKTIPEEQKNNWSKGDKGENGDPITIIRNGQSVVLDEQGWVPTIENINLDPSSIYLTSNQKIDNFSIAAPDCWYSFGLNAVVPQNDNEEAKKFLDSPIDYVLAEEIEVEEVEPNNENASIPPSTQESTDTQEEVIEYEPTEEETETGEPEETITEEEYLQEEEVEDTTEYYQQDDSQTDLEAIARPPLPSSYVLATSENNCSNCFFHENNYCNKWNAKVRANHENPWVCNAWKEIEPPPPPPSPVEGVLAKIRIRNEKLTTEAHVRAYGIVQKIEDEGNKEGKWTINIPGQSTIIGQTDLNLSPSQASDNLILDEVMFIQYSWGLPDEFRGWEIGEPWPESKWTEIQAEIEAASQDPRELYGIPNQSGEQGFTQFAQFDIVAPSNLVGRRGTITQSWEGEDQYGNPDRTRITISIVGGPEQTTPPVDPETTPNILNGFTRSVLPQMLGEAPNTVLLNFNNQPQNNWFSSQGVPIQSI